MDNVAARPPFWPRFAFRAFGWKLDASHRDWLLDDVRSGRNFRWRIVATTALGGATYALVYGALLRRGGSGILGSMVGPAIGWVIGIAVAAGIMRRSPKWRFDKALASQGFLPDGDPDPHPRGLARLDNYQRLALQAISLTLLAVLAGLLPRVLIPTPLGQCVTPSAAAVAGLEATLRPGVAVDHVQLYKKERGAVAFVSGTVNEVYLTWWKDDAGFHALTPPAATASNVPTDAVLTHGVSLSDGFVESQRCVERAIRDGRGRSLRGS